MVFVIGLLDRVGEDVPANMPSCTFREGCRDKMPQWAEIARRKVSYVKSNVAKILQYISQLPSGICLYQRLDAYAIGSRLDQGHEAPVSNSPKLPAKNPVNKNSVGVKKAECMVKPKNQRSTGLEDAIAFGETMHRVVGMVKDAKAVDHIEGAALKWDGGGGGVFQGGAQAAHLEVTRGEFEMPRRDVDPVNICSSVGKLHQVGTLADADLQNFLPSIRAEVDVLAHPRSVVLITVALDRLKVGEAILVEAIKGSARAIGPLVDGGFVRSRQSAFNHDQHCSR
jgi:hypothetical protein